MTEPAAASLTTGSPERISFAEMALALTLMLPRLRSGIEHDLHMARWVADQIGLPLPSVELSIAQMERDVAVIEALPDRLKQLADIELEIDALISRKSTGAWISPLRAPDGSLRFAENNALIGAQP